MPRATERLGVFGGTFDPVHVGHIVVAVETRHALTLDRVLLVVAGDPWQKRGAVIAAADERFGMVEAAVRDIDGVEASRVEIDRVGASVTADTLEALAAPDRELFLILGSDAASNMGTWRRLDDTRPLCTVVVVERAGEHPVPPGPEWRFERVPIPRLDVSSTEIRARVAAGRPIDGLVPPGAVRFIHEHGLYAQGQ